MESLKLERRAILFLFLPIFFLIIVCKADLITLNNGNTLFGEIVEETETYLMFKTPLGISRLPKSEVKALLKEPKAQTYIKFGDFFMERKDYRSALKSYEQAFSYDSTSPLLVEKIKTAKELLVDSATKKATALLKQGDELVEEGKFSKAIETYGEITTLLDLPAAENWHKRVNEKISACYIKWALSSESNAAINYLKRAIELTPDSSVAYFHLGQIYFRRGDLNTAKEYLVKAVKLDPSFVTGHLTLANVYFKLKDFPNALFHYQKVEEITPSLLTADVRLNYAETLYVIATTLYAQEKYEEALANFEKYVILNPKGDWKMYYLTQYKLKAKGIVERDASQHYDLGIFCESKGLFQEAIYEFQTALKLDPGFLEARARLIKLYDRFAKELYDKGVAAYNRNDFYTALVNFSKVTANYWESTFRPEAIRMINITRNAIAKQIYTVADLNFRRGYFEEAYLGFETILKDYKDTDWFLDAQRMLAKTRSKLSQKHFSIEEEKKRKVNELLAYIESIADPKEKQDWQTIIDISKLSVSEFERAIALAPPSIRRLIRSQLDRVVYLYYDKMPIIIAKLNLPRERIRTEEDRLAMYMLALELVTCVNTEEYNAWSELIPYFGDNREALLDHKSELSIDAQRLIEERMADVIRLLNLR